MANIIGITEFSVTIANGGDTSGAIKMDPLVPVAILLPAAFTGTSISFLACGTSGGTYLPLYDAGSLLSVTVGTSRMVVLDQNKFLGVRYIKIKSGSTEGGDRVLTILGRRVRQ